MKNQADDLNREERALVHSQPGQAVVPSPEATREVVRRHLEVLAGGRRDQARARELLQDRLPLHRTDPQREDARRAERVRWLQDEQRRRLESIEALWASGKRNDRIQALKGIDRWLEQGEFELLEGLSLVVLQDYIDHSKPILLLRFLSEEKLIALNQQERFPYAVVATALTPEAEPGEDWQPNHAYFGARKIIQHLLRDWDREDYAYISHFLVRKYGRRVGRAALLEQLHVLWETFRASRRAFFDEMTRFLAAQMGMLDEDVKRLIRPFFRYRQEDLPWLEGQRALITQRLEPLARTVIDYQVFPAVVLDDPFAVDEVKGHLIDSLLLSGDTVCLKLETHPRPFRPVELELIGEVWHGIESPASETAGDEPDTAEAILGRTLKGSFDYSLWTLLGRRHTFALGEGGTDYSELSQAVVEAAPFPLPADLRPYLERNRQQVYQAMASLKTNIRAVDVDGHEFFCTTILPILEAIWRGQVKTALDRIGELGHRWSRTWAFDVPRLLSQCLIPLLQVLEKARPPSPQTKDALERARTLIAAECSTRLTRAGEAPPDHSWLGLPQVQVRLDRNTCLPGETIQGVLILILARPTRLRGLQVRLTGRAWANFLGSADDVLLDPSRRTLADLLGVRYVRESRPILEQYLLVAGDWDDPDRSDQPLEMPPGEYRGRFSMEVSQAAPPSYQGSYAGTTYEVTAQADQGWLWTQTAREVLTVLPLVPVLEGKDLEFDHRYCHYNVPWGDRAFLRVIVRGAPFQAGERIRGTLTLQNLANQPAQSLSVCLVGTESAFSQDRQVRRTHTITAIEQEVYGEIPVGESVEYPFDLDIPLDIPRTASGSFFDLTWSVEVRLRYGPLDTLTAAKPVGIY